MALTKESMHLEDEELILAEVPRHPIGLIAIYLSGLGVIGLALLFLYMTIQNKVDLGIGDSSGDSITFVFMAFVFLIFMFTMIAGRIYKNNLLIVTNRNIIQFLQFGLFSTQESRLNLAKMQDVSVDQMGIVANMFGYGTIDIETAGEQANYRFKFAPKPQEIAKILTEAHEEYMQKFAHDHSDGL